MFLFGNRIDFICREAFRIKGRFNSFVFAADQDSGTTKTVRLDNVGGYRRNIWLNSWCSIVNSNSSFFGVWLCINAFRATAAAREQDERRDKTKQQNSK